MADDKWLGVSKEARKFQCIYCRNDCRRYYATETGNWMHEYVITTTPRGEKIPEEEIRSRYAHCGVTPGLRKLLRRAIASGRATK